MDRWLKHTHWTVGNLAGGAWWNFRGISRTFGTGSVNWWGPCSCSINPHSMHVTLTPFSDLSHEGPQKYTSDLCVSLSIFHTSRFVLSPCVPFLSHANLLRIVPGLTCHKKHKQDSNTPPQELYGGLDTPNAALASSRAFLPRTLVKASAKIGWHWR